MFESQSNVISDLISILKEKNSILMAGAGLSKFAGYPLWQELVDDLRNEFHNSLTIDEDLDIISSAIKEFAKANGRENQFYNYVEDLFEPKPKTHCEIHLNLLKLGFCGVVTTNYDVVLENAMTNFFKDENQFYNCKSKNLCSSRNYPIIKYLRSISPNKNPGEVLHLHGIYSNPKQLILTRDDYLHYYGDSIQESITGSDKLITLETIHTKVIWSLLASYNFIFVGFSLNDPFFLKILETVNYDFDNPIVMHHAIMHCTSEEDKEKISELLKHQGVQPIFYHVPQDDPNDHSNLNLLISTLITKLEDAAEEDLEEDEVQTEDLEKDKTEADENLAEPEVNSISKGLLE